MGNGSWRACSVSACLLYYLWKWKLEHSPGSPSVSAGSTGAGVLIRRLVSSSVEEITQG